MSEKNGFKGWAESFIEKTIESSQHLKKIVDNITLIANETQKVAQAILALNNRINEHEQLILRLVELQKIKPKDPLEIDILPQKNKKPSKPN